MANLLCREGVGCRWGRGNRCPPPAVLPRPPRLYDAGAWAPPFFLLLFIKVPILGVGLMANLLCREGVGCRWGRGSRRPPPAVLPRPPRLYDAGAWAPPFFLQSRRRWSVLWHKAQTLDVNLHWAAVWSVAEHK